MMGLIRRHRRDRDVSRVEMDDVQKRLGAVEAVIRVAERRGRRE